MTAKSSVSLKTHENIGAAMFCVKSSQSNDLTLGHINIFVQYFVCDFINYFIFNVLLSYCPSVVRKKLCQIWVFKVCPISVKHNIEILTI